MPVIKVNDSEISIGYLIRRLEAADSNDIFAMMQALTNEELIRQAAPRLGIEITDEEIDETLHDVARGDNESISEPEFQNWYRLQLNESRLSETEFRELWRTILISARIHEIEAAEVDTVAEQVRLSAILTDSYETALEAYNRLEEGEAFDDVAIDTSIDPAVAENGTDQGWFPEAALPSSARYVFQLTVGEHSPPITLTDDGSLYGVFLVTDQAASREIDEYKLAMVRAGVLDEWLIEESSRNEITFHGRDWSPTVERYTFGSETQAWIAWQLAKRTSVNRE